MIVKARRPAVDPQLAASDSDLKFAKAKRFTTLDGAMAQPFHVPRWADHVADFASKGLPLADAKKSLRGEIQERHDQVAIESDQRDREAL